MIFRIRLSLILFFAALSFSQPLSPLKPFRLLGRAVKTITKPVARLVKGTQNKIKAIYFNTHVVEHGKLYRSGQLSTKELERVLNGRTFGVKIKTVINLRGEFPHAPWFIAEKQLCAKYGAKLISIRMNAHTLSSQENLEKLLEAFETAPRPILVHCQGGADRTSEAAALWKLEQQKTSKKEALQQMTLLRHRHVRKNHPAKTKLIHLWDGKQWLKTKYNPQLLATQK